MSALTEAQQTALRVVPRVTAALSFLGSGFILLSQWKRQWCCWKQPQHARAYNSTSSSSSSPLVGKSLLLGMSVADLLSSSSYLIGDAAFPSPPHGSEATCKLQGLLCHLQVGAAIYSGFLAWYYCLFVRYNWREKQLSQVYLPAAHIVVWVFLIITGGLALQWMHPHWIRCYISGPGSNLYFWLYFYVPIWTSMFMGSIAMVLIYLTVRQTEEKSLQYRFSTEETLRSSSRLRPSATEFPLTHRVSYQAMGYMISFIANYVFPTTSRIIITTNNVPPFAIRLLAVSTVTSQGFWNWIVYFLVPQWYNWRFQAARARSHDSPQIDVEGALPEQSSGEERNVR